jgi:hypothetical protein
VVATRVDIIDGAPRAGIHQRRHQHLTARWLGRGRRVDTGQHALPLPGLESMLDRVRGHTGFKGLYATDHVILRSEQAW